MSGQQKNKPFILIDDEDFDYLSKFRWYNNKGYAVRIGETRGNLVKMHREILGLGKNLPHVDHIDHNRLNNQKHNLRTVTPQENALNSAPRYKNNTSGTKGVYWHKNREKWQVYITRNNKHIYFGCFANKKEAINARRTAEEQILAIDAPVQD